MNTENRPASYPLRLEPETRTKIEAIAKANGRSLNAQIVLILDGWLSGVTTADSPPITVEEVRRIALEVVREELAKAGKQ